MNVPLPTIIRSKLEAFERGRGALLALGGLAESGMVFCAGLLLVLLIEWLAKPHLTTRLCLSTLNYCAAAGFVCWRVVWPLFRSRSLREAGWALEKAAGGKFQERIIAAVELSEQPETTPGVSRWMTERTIALAAEEIAAIDPVSLLNRSPVVLAWKRASAVLCSWLLLCVLPGVAPRAWLALNPYAATARFSRVQLVVWPGNHRLPQGAPMEIRATGPNLPYETKATIKWADGFQETVAMTRTSTNLFTLPLAAVSQGFDYLVQAGDAESPLFRVGLDVPPRLARIHLEVQPPAYTGWTNRHVEGGSAEFLAGSRIRIQADTADEKIGQAEWVADAPEIRSLQPENDHVSLDLWPTNQLSYQLRFTGANKLRSESQKFVLRPTEDQPPQPSLVVIGSEPGMVQSDEILPLQALATDDVGMQTVQLIVLSRDAELAVKPIYQALTNAIPSREVRQMVNYNLADLNCATGDELQFQLLATDVRGQTVRTEPLSFTIGSRDKALEAQLAVRIRRLVSDIAAESEDLEQTRGSWLSIARNYREQDARSQLPALVVLQSRLNSFGAEMENIGQRLENESETNNAPEARFMYRLGTTISSWGRQQREVLLSNCGQLEQVAATNLYETFSLGRELFSRALLDLEQYRRVVSILAGVFETDVLATRCESAQGRYKRALPVLRGENIIAPLGQNGPGLAATFFEGITLNGKVLEQKIEKPRFDNYAPAGRRENWSARYEGDLNISNEAEWSLACVADDGVRLKIDGRSVLAGDSWANHPATQFKGDIRLTAGWHPVTIEFFQGSSESKLQFLAAKKGETLQEVPVEWLRPPSARQTKPPSETNATLNAIAQDALKDRTRNSLLSPANVPAQIAPLTNDVQNETFVRSVREKFPVSESLQSNLTLFASWNPDDSRKAEGQADELTALSRDAQRLLKEELEKYRWRYEGAAALKPIQNAIEELREIKQELRQQPWHERKTRTEQEQARVDVAQAWEKELRRATATAAHDLFETAKQKDATLAERATALTATTKIEKDFQPSLKKLDETLKQDLSKDEMAGQIEQRINELNDRFRELNELQEKINREEVSATARKAFPAARNFERAQKAQTAELGARYEQMRNGVDDVAHAERVAGDYTGADRLATFAGNSTQNANGKETTREVRDLANRTDRNVPSLAQSIPPPMKEDAKALAEQKQSAPEAANDLAKPRLGMALESARLAQQGDRKTAVAYGLLGEDLGALLDSPKDLTAATLQPLADRAEALAGEKGEEARQAEIRAANERAKQLAERSPQDAQALANQLEEMSVLAKQAAGDRSKRPPLNSELAQTSKLAPPVPNYYDSTDPREIAASAAQQSADELQAAPDQWESYNDASQQLADAARQIEMNQASAELAELNPFAAPQTAAEMLAQGKPGSTDMNGDIQGQAGQALTQPVPKGMDQAEWARLNERLRQAIRSSGIENFTEEHQAAIRAYFERLSADSQKTKVK